MDVLEHLELGAFSRKDNEGIQKDIQRVYEYFPRLEERKKQKAGTLSGGEQQMLAIGRALMSQPKIIMFDEPSLGLAPLLVEQIGKIIQEIHAAGTTVLLVEQNAFFGLNVIGSLLRFGNRTGGPLRTFAGTPPERGCKARLSRGLSEPGSASSISL